VTLARRPAGHRSRACSADRFGGTSRGFAPFSAGILECGGGDAVAWSATELQHP
jgi:hypothetical protein